MPFAERSFDGAYMLHVGMNIEDKETLATEVARVLRPNSAFGIYDVMRTGSGDLDDPVPWATTPDLSAVAEPGRYRAALQSPGFTVIAERSRRDFALAFFAELRAGRAAAAGAATARPACADGRQRAGKSAEHDREHFERLYCPRSN